MGKVKIIVVDDHTLFRRGLVSLLSDMEEFSVCGEGNNGEDAVILVRELKPDLVLMDINMPVMDGIQALETIRLISKEQKVVMLTISQKDDDLVRAITAGANGYILKNAEPDVFKATLLDVMKGNSVLSHEMTEKVFESLRRARLSQGQTILSGREVDVLKLMAKGASTREMAESLFISENTVKTHIRHILEKLEVNSRVQAVSKAVELKII